jgi:hypothetical protein
MRMTQCEIEEAVALATGESITMIQDLGFGLADSIEVNYDPDPCRLFVLDWDGTSTE